MYESDITKFMREFLKRHPEEIESQKAGRAAWWDKKPGGPARVPNKEHAPRSGGNEHTFAAADDDQN